MTSPTTQIERVTTRRGAFADEPPRERPDSPPKSYGVPRKGGTFIEWSDVIERLRTASGYWLATVTPGGRPHVVPIWGVVVGDDLFLETGAPDTIKNRNLAVHEEIAVHLDGVDDVVLVRGRATPAAPDADLGAAMAAAFHAKYPGYEPGPTDWDRGGLIRIEPATLLAWREMPTATRWRFAGEESGLVTETNPRDRLVANIGAERAWWAGLVEEIGEDRMGEPGPMGEWTFKDLASHLLGWRDRTIARLEAAAAGREEPPLPWPAELGDEEDDPINAWIHERTRDRPLRDVLDDVDRSYERLANAIAALPEDLVTRPDAFPWADGEALADAQLFGHLHDEHEPALRAWLDGQT